MNYQVIMTTKMQGDKIGELVIATVTDFDDASNIVKQFEIKNRDFSLYVAALELMTALNNGYNEQLVYSFHIRTV